MAHLMEYQKEYLIGRNLGCRMECVRWNKSWSLLIDIEVKEAVSWKKDYTSQIVDLFQWEGCTSDKGEEVSSYLAEEEGIKEPDMRSLVTYLLMYSKVTLGWSTVYCCG